MPHPLQNKSFILSVALALLAAALFPASVLSEETSTAPALEKPANASNWGFNLTSYLWLQGLDGSVTSGSHTGSVDANFIDIVNKSRRFPLGFMGRFEAHYDRFALYLDGVYTNLRLKPKLDRISEGIDAEMGIMDYGLMYRIFGATPSEMPNYQGKKRPNLLEVYAGARTIWLGSSVALSGPFGLIQHTPAANSSFTSPVIGGRLGFDLTPHWFLLADGNVGGFGAQSVEFTGSILGVLGYRTTFFGVPASVEAGYKALSYNVDKGGPTAANVTLNGPFIGLTGYW